MATKYDIRDYLKAQLGLIRPDTREAEEMQALIDALENLEQPRDTTYNGYPNYETWDVALWIDNDQLSQREVLDLAASAISAYEFSSELREWVEENLITYGECSGITADLVNAALSEVNWTHLAQNYIDEASENEEYELKKDKSLYDITADYASGAETVFTGTAQECRLWIKAKAADHCRNSNKPEYKHAEYIQATLNEWRDDDQTQIGLYTYERYDHEEPEDDDSEAPVPDMDDPGN